MIVCCRDTDVLFCVVSGKGKGGKEVWMKAGTKKRPQMMGIHDIRPDEDIRQGLLVFHAVNSCDTTSQFARILAKNSAWKVFVKKPHLHTLSQDQTPGPDVFAAVEAFVCKLYDPSTSTSVCRLLTLSPMQNEHGFSATDGASWKRPTWRLTNANPSLANYR